MSILDAILPENLRKRNQKEYERLQDLLRQAVANVLKTGYSEDSRGYNACVNQEFNRLMNELTNKEQQ